MNHRTTIAGVLVAFGSLLAPPPAVADIAVPGWKPVHARAVLEAGRFDDYCEHRYTVVAGDTLEKIAKGIDGDAARAAEIVKANPGTVPERLVVGSKLVVPAKSTPSADAKETLAWRFYVCSEFSPVTAFERVFPDEPFASPGKAPSLVAMPEVKGAEFEKLLAAADRGGSGAVRAAAPWLVACEWFEPTSSIREQSTATQCTTTFRVGELRNNAKGRLVLRVTEVKTEYTDADGRPAKASLFGDVRSLVLLTLALVGAFGLVQLRRRRLAQRG